MVNHIGFVDFYSTQRQCFASSGISHEKAKGRGDLYTHTPMYGVRCDLLYFYEECNPHEFTHVGLFRNKGAHVQCTSLIT